jgi:hypothetical protein
MCEDGSEARPERSRRDPVRAEQGSTSLWFRKIQQTVRMSTGRATLGLDGSETRPFTAGADHTSVHTYLLGSTTTAVPYASTSVTPCITSVAS